MSSGTKFLWASPKETSRLEVLEAAARDFGLDVRFCSYGQLLDVVRDEACDVAGIEFGPKHGESLALLRELHTRAPRLTIIAAAADSGFDVLRAALDAGATDFFSLALRLLRGQFRYTIVDTPRTITGTTLAAFEQADRLLLLADLSVPGVRSARRLLELWSRMNIPFERIALLFSMLTRGPVTHQDAVRALGKEPVLVVPHDPAAATI